jgi:hypothetical protein
MDRALVLRGIHTIHQALMRQFLLKNPASPAKAGRVAGAESTEWF